MKTNKITLATNIVNANKTKLNKKNNNLNTSFKGSNLFAPRKKHQVVQSLWNKLFPKLQSGLVKTVYNDLTPISKEYTAEEVKFYYKKNDDKLILKIFQNCTLNKDKKIEKASKIFYQYDTSENGGLKQKIIINPEFNNGKLSKAECVYEFYENHPDRKQVVIHNDAKFRNDAIISSKSSEFVYDDDSKDYYTDALFNLDGAIHSFAKKEQISMYKEGNKNIKKRIVWLDSNNEVLKPDFCTCEETEKEKPDRKIYVENPVFRDDNTIQSAKLGLKIIGQTSYTSYNSVYDKDGFLESAELYRVKKLDVDKEAIEKKAKKLKDEISYMCPLLSSMHAQIKKLEERQKELGRKYIELQKQYYDNKLKIKEKKETPSVLAIEPEQKSMSVKELLKVYENKSVSPKQTPTIAIKQQNSLSPKIKNLLKIYENKSVTPAIVTEKSNQSSPKVRNSLKVVENKSVEKEERESTTTLLELMDSIKKEKGELQIRIDQMKEIHQEKMEKLHNAYDSLKELMSYDRVYNNYTRKVIFESTPISYENKMNEKFQFKHKELIDNE